MQPPPCPKARLGLSVKLGAIAPLVFTAANASAQPASTESTTAQPAPQSSSNQTATPSATAERRVPNPHSVKPQAELPGPAKVRFMADPVVDGAALSLAIGIAGLSQAIIGTGEITPQRPNPDADFLFIDRGVIDQKPQPAWDTVSTIGVGLAIGLAVADPIESAARHNAQAAVVDGIMYAETLSITWAVTNVTKIAFRRPRPAAYAAQAKLDEICEGRDPTTCVSPSISDTDSALSFFSGHASITAAAFATGTYLAFAREPGTARPWIMLGAGTVVTTLVDIGRVKAGEHFPTDVIAGSMVGIGIGILVPHLRRADAPERRAMWVGFEPVPGGGGAVTLNGTMF